MGVGEDIPLQLDNCIFRDNFSPDVGGAVFNQGGLVRITDCLFMNNQAVMGGAVTSTYGEVEIEGCTFVGNAAEDGGALMIMGYGSNTIRNCTLVGNDALRGSGIFFGESYEATLRVERTLVAYGQGGEGFYWDGTDTLLVADCDIFGNKSGDWVGAVAGFAGVDGNMSLAPLFCDLEGGVLTLGEDSPCLPANNFAGVFIGAHGLGCGAMSGTHHLPGHPVLLGSHPNPFNPRTVIRLDMPADGQARVEVFDLRGRLVAKLADRGFPAGQQDLVWDGRDQQGRNLPSGMYLVSLQTPAGSSRLKITLSR